MLHLDLFSGIGGFALATEMVWENVEHVFCDNDPFAQAILKKHWPNAPIYDDIQQLITHTPKAGQKSPTQSSWKCDCPASCSGNYEIYY